MAKQDRSQNCFITKEKIHGNVISCQNIARQQWSIAMVTGFPPGSPDVVVLEQLRRQFKQRVSDTLKGEEWGFAKLSAFLIEQLL